MAIIFLKNFNFATDVSSPPLPGEYLHKMYTYKYIQIYTMYTYIYKQKSYAVLTSLSHKANQ